MSVYVLTAARNHGAFIEDCIKSVQAQTVSDWRMLVLDDGSGDDTVARVEACATRDARITLHRAPAPPSGALGAYLQLIALVPEGQDVALLDGDDRWLPTHLAESLAALRNPTGATGASLAQGTDARATPTLVHGDLALIDADGRELSPSLWRAAALAPRPATLRRLAIDNTVTGSTIAMNAALVAAIVARAPKQNPLLYQDSWFALAAAALGGIVSRPQVTVQYRQHGQNLVGAAPSEAPSLRHVPERLARAHRNRERLRRDLARSYAQAAAFAESFGDALAPDDRAFLERYAEIPRCAAPLRMWRLFTMRRSPSATLIRRLGEALRG